MQTDQAKPKTYLAPFKFFGVEFYDEGNGKDNVVASCLFCGKENHTFVNRYKGLWDCKVCGRAGNLSDFLDAIYDDLLDRTSEQAIVKLANYRKLPVSIFQKWRIAHTPDNDTYLIPCRGFNGKLINLYWYRIGQKCQSIPGCELGLFGLNQLTDPTRQNEVVFINESEFNCLALDWLLRENNLDGICVATHGANSFKSEFVPYFSGRKVIICHDNDGGGEAGNERVHKILEPVTKKPHYVFTWPNDLPSGYDINDLISAFGFGTNSPVDCYKNKFLPRILQWDEYKAYKVNPASINFSEKVYNKLQLPPELPPSGVITIPDMMKQYGRILDLNDDLEKMVRLALATIMSIKIPGPCPAWLFLVGPPGFGKTELLNSFKNCPEYAYYQSNLARSTLVSGMPGAGGTDPSLLPKLHNLSLVLKDYTEILSKNSEDRNEIFGLLRGAFDGSVDRMFGNMIHRVYDPIRFGMVAGVTNEIMNFAQASVGERFLRFKMDTSLLSAEQLENQQIAAMSNSLKNESAKLELQNSVNVFLSQKWDFSSEHLESIKPEWFYKKIAPLARLAAWLRTPVKRHEMGVNRNEVAYDPDAESGNRIGVQLQRLALSLTVLEMKLNVDESILRLMQRIAMDTVTSYTTKIARALYIADKPIDRQGINERLGINVDFTYQLEDLIILKIVSKIREKVSEQRYRNLYTLSSEAKDLFIRADL